MFLMKSEVLTSPVLQRSICLTVEATAKKLTLMDGFFVRQSETKDSAMTPSSAPMVYSSPAHK